VLTGGSHHALRRQAKKATTLQFRVSEQGCTPLSALLAAHDIQRSMSRIGNPYDNAKAESFMKSLKQEEIDGTGLS
jgi:transposase InsO family protein